MFRTKMVALCAISTIASLSASAQTFSLRFAGADQGRELRVRHPEMRGGNFMGYVGSLNYEATPLSGGSTMPVNYLTYCATPRERIDSNQSNSHDYDLLSVFDERMVLGDSAQEAADREQAIADVTAAAAGMQLMPTENFAVAFQLIVWEIILDYDANVGASSLDLVAGSMRSTEADDTMLDAEVFSIFASLRSAVGSGTGDTSLIAAFNNETWQDQLIFVPAPGSAMLLGAAGFIAARRRRS